MGIGISLFLIAVGAILKFAVHTSVNGLDVHTVGVILMIVGGIGILVDLVIFTPRRSRHAQAQVYAPDPSIAPSSPPLQRDEADRGR